MHGECYSKWALSTQIQRAEWMANRHSAAEVLYQAQRLHWLSNRKDLDPRLYNVKMLHWAVAATFTWRMQAPSAGDTVNPLLCMRSKASWTRGSPPALCSKNRPGFAMGSQQWIRCLLTRNRLVREASHLFRSVWYFLIPSPSTALLAFSFHCFLKAVVIMPCYFPS